MVIDTKTVGITFGSLRMGQITSPEIDAFLTELRRQELAASTIASYKGDLSAFAGWFVRTTGEVFTPQTVTPSDVLDHKSYLRTVQRRQAATVNRRQAALRKFFLWARATGRITDLPTLEVKSVPTGSRAPKSWAKREADRLIRAVEQSANTRDLAVLLTLRHTGVRVGELCALRIPDLSILDRKGSMLVRSGKRDKDRTIPLNNDVRLALRAYLAKRPAATDDHVFIGQRGEALQPEAVQLIVRKYARQAGLAEVTPHILRHTFAKQVLDAGANLTTVSRLLGHERLDTTAIYTQPTARDLVEAVQRLERQDAE
jgi:site-specific recombinase XerD